jgi:spore coat polysaccharide biosynthesis protein SpsF (cytidylyltransferase family)
MFDYAPHIDYTDDEEYQQVYRYIFGISDLEIDESFTINTPDEVIDAWLMEKMQKDDERIDARIDEIFEKTREHPLFRKLYEEARQLWFSEDMKMGLYTMFSFDFLKDFYPFFMEGNPTDENPHYRNMIDRMQKIRERKSHCNV